MEIPKVPGLPIIGHSIPFQRNALNFTAEKQKKYGDIFQISLLNENFIVLLTPEITKEVFLDKDDNFSSKEGWAVTLGPTFENGDHSWCKKVHNKLSKQFVKIFSQICENGEHFW